MAIRHIVFDIGGVLANFRLKEFLADKGFDADMTRRIIRAAVMSTYWGRFERGEISEEETLRGFAEGDPEISAELITAFSDLSGMLTPCDYALPLVKGLRGAGYGVYYLSNYSKKAYDDCASSLSFMPYMDGGLVSFRVGLTKPDRNMFRLFLKEYGLKAEECLFIDDTPENVDAAKALGFAGTMFRSYDQLLADLKGMGISPRP